MTKKRKVEVFTAGCPICEKTVSLVRQNACPSCEIIVYDLSKTEKGGEGRKRTIGYQVKSVPAVAIDGKLASCCSSKGVDLESLKREGLGQPL